MTSRLLQISAAAALVMAAAAPARAQAGGWLGSAPAAYANDDYRTSYADAQRSAYDFGYRDGLKRGEQAARDRRGLDVERERDYRQADNGYNRSFGDRNRYRDNYRFGFAQGYRDAYNRGGYGSDRGAYGNGRVYPDANQRYPDANRGYPEANRGYGGYGSTAGYGARQNGVTDGYRKGLDDVRDRKYPDVSRQKWYRNGDHDYNSRYGSKESYRVEYRRGFEEGYNRAYREGRRDNR
jgi:hypothetical protein